MSTSLVRTPKNLWVDGPVRSALAALALTAAVGSVLSPAPAQAATATGRVQLVSHSSEADSYGYIKLAGQVVNHTGRSVSFVSIVVDQLDRQGKLLATSTTYAQTSVLDDGESSGFTTTLKPLAGYDHLAIRSVGGSPSYRPANRNFAVTVTNRYRSDSGQDHIVGTIKNLNNTKASFVSVEATYFDAAGTAIGATSDYPTTADGSGEMAAGETDSFDVTYYGSSTPASYVLLGDSIDEPSPLPTSWVSSSGGARTHGQSAAIAGRLTKRGTDTGHSGAAVQLLAQTAGSSAWTVLLSAKTDYDGKVAFSPRPERNTSYAIRLPASTTQTGSQSPSHAVVVNALHGVRLSANNLALGRATSLTATVAPSQAGRTVTLQRLTAGKWTDVASHALGSSSSWGFTVKPTVRGTYTYRTSTTAYAGNGAGTSAPVTLKVS